MRGVDSIPIDIDIRSHQSIVFPPRFGDLVVTRYQERRSKLINQLDSFARPPQYLPARQ